MTLRRQIMLSTAVLLTASVVVGQADGEKAFKSYMDFAVGGTWTTTVDGERIESSYKRVVDSQFVQLTNKGVPLPFVAMIGVDPKTKNCTWWFFNNDGGIGKDVLIQEADKVWLLEGTGIGPKDRIRYRGRITQIDENTGKEEVLRFMIGKEDHGSFTAT
jgi:hypothetical protein